MSMFKDKELRGYLGSAIVFVLIMGLLIKQKDELESMHINLQQMIVEKLSIAGSIFEINDMKINEISEYNKNKTK